MSGDWRWIVGRNVIDLTIDLRSLMIGFAFGDRDVVMHIGCVTITIEHWPSDPSTSIAPAGDE
jgi:hypothetical protein